MIRAGDVTGRLSERAQMELTYVFESAVHTAAHFVRTSDGGDPLDNLVAFVRMPHPTDPTGVRIATVSTLYERCDAGVFLAHALSSLVALRESEHYTLADAEPIAVMRIILTGDDEPVLDLFGDQLQCPAYLIVLVAAEVDNVLHQVARVHRLPEYGLAPSDALTVVAEGWPCHRTPWIEAAGRALVPLE